MTSSPAAASATQTDWQILPLERTSAGIKRFIRVSYRIYQNDPCWVAPLEGDLKRVFTDENPLYEHTRIQLWVATRHGQDVGRIAGILDDSYTTPDGGRGAFFGFFECQKDPELSRALFEVVFEWARRHKAKCVLGPVNPSTNDECGLLVDGFDSAPVFMMPYNPRYYVDLVEAAGFRKTKDLLAYNIVLSSLPMDRLSRIADKVIKRFDNLALRRITKKSLHADLAKLKEVYNSAWEDNWGFVAMTDSEMQFMADRLKPLLTEGLVWLAEIGQEPVGFLLAMPDFNIPMKPLRGKLLTPALLKFIPYVLGWKIPPRTRVLTLGVKAKHRAKGIETAMLIQGLKFGFSVGVKESEASWILEDNTMMRRMLETINGQVYKTYRLYRREV